jgi:beta-xylosidase
LIFTRTNGGRWQGAEAPEIVYHDGYYYLFLAETIEHPIG